MKCRCRWPCGLRQLLAGMADSNPAGDMDESLIVVCGQVDFPASV